jgi:hypothetical protein
VTPPDGRGDFDFLLGSWRVANRRLRTPLEPADGTEEEFETSAVVRPVLGGLGNTDTITGSPGPDGQPFEGLTLRLFDPDDGLWRIWWASSRRPGHLDAPLTGSFSDGHGVFSGDDTVDGVPVRIRFDWTVPAPGTARWVQAFSLDGGGTWSTNWVMDFRRAGGPAA